MDILFYYKTSLDWGASAKQESDTTDNASVDEVFMGYKLSKNSTISIGKQKIPVSFAESTSSNDLPFIESDELGSNWRFGTLRINVRPDGKR